MIGIFDSGVGGLTVLKALREVLPSADVLYFGDTKHAPYGLRPREELTSLTVAALKLLQDRGAQHIVSACNSVSASLAVSLLDAFSIQPKQLIEMVGPTVSYFKGSTARLLLCATPATISSGIYQNAFQMIGKDIQTVALPELAGAIEAGKSDAELEAIVRHAFPEPPNADVLILACTHYPLAVSAFRNVLGKTFPIFDPALAVAERAKKQFWPQEVGSATTHFVISSRSPQFRDTVSRLFPGMKFELEVLE